MSCNTYILKGHEPRGCPDALEWARWFEKAGDARVVARTSVGGREVSTVFLGVDHAFGGPPMLFETMVFPECEICERCSTWAEAEAQHARVLAAVQEGA